MHAVIPPEATENRQFCYSYRNLNEKTKGFDSLKLF